MGAQVELEMVLVAHNVQVGDIPLVIANAVENPDIKGVVINEHYIGGTDLEMMYHHLVRALLPADNPTI